MVPTFAFFCLNAGARLTMGHKRCGRNIVTTGSEVKDTGWRAHPRDIVMGEKAPGSSGPWGGRRVWGHCFRAKPSRGHRGTDLETGPQKLRQGLSNWGGLGLKKLGVSRGQRPKERKNLVLGVWVDRTQEGSQQFSSFKFKVYALTLLPTASAESQDSCTGRSSPDCDKASN